MLLLAVGVSGCGDGRVRSADVAAAAGLTRVTLPGAGFTHVAWRGPHRGGMLHVYLDGDGSPWLPGNLIAADPTPRNPLVHRLLALDPNPTLYLGRPCYHGLAQAPGCGPALWTDARYSEPVVASMTAALARFSAEQGIDELVLIGYSGGGVLGWLIAERLPTVRALVTVAANLDVDAWTAHHGYRPLTASLNPARRGPLPARIVQLHVVGARDTNVPAQLNRAMLQRGAGPVRVLTLPAAHACCWEPLWPDVLAALEQLTETRQGP